MVRRGHFPVFFERDVPYYAQHRDLFEIEGGELILYSEWKNVLPLARRHLADADVAMATSYCPDGVNASDLLLASNALRVFYDLDTPVTLASVRNGQAAPYLSPRGLRDFDLVLSYTGGAALTEIRQMLGARDVAPLYGSADPDLHFPVEPVAQYRADLSYLGTYAADRQAGVEQLFVEPARRLPERQFILGGSMYPQDFPWTPNMRYFEHVAPAEHPPFYCSARLNLSVTRGVMAAMGYCPSGRLFEAAACGAPIVTDYWEGLETFFDPGADILIAESTEQAIEHLTLLDYELARIGRAARERTLEEHTADARAAQLESILAKSLSAEVSS